MHQVGCRFSSYILKTIYQGVELISPYLSFIFVLIFMVPWINNHFAFHNSEQILTMVEVFVLSSATLSLLIFTYIMALSDLHEKVKRSMVKAGESFFISTVQFIVGLGLFSLVNILKSHYIGFNTFTYTLSFNNLLFLVLILIQLVGIYEVASALSKFIKGIMEVYTSFRVIKRPNFYKFVQNLLK